MAERTRDDDQQARDDEAADQQPELAALAAQRRERVEPPPQAEDQALARLDRGPQHERVVIVRVAAEHEARVLLGGRDVAAMQGDHPGDDVGVLMMGSVVSAASMRRWASSMLPAQLDARELVSVSTCRRAGERLIEQLAGGLGLALQPRIDAPST